MSFHLAEDHPWQSAKEEWEINVLPRLERDGMKIGAEAKAGSDLAARVIEAYKLLHRSFDPMALELLKIALKHYDTAPTAAKEGEGK